MTNRAAHFPRRQLTTTRELHNSRWREPPVCALHLLPRSCPAAGMKPAARTHPILEKHDSRWRVPPFCVYFPLLSPPGGKAQIRGKWQKAPGRTSAMTREPGRWYKLGDEDCDEGVALHPVA